MGFLKEKKLFKQNLEDLWKIELYIIESEINPEYNWVEFFTFIYKDAKVQRASDYPVQRLAAELGLKPNSLNPRIILKFVGKICRNSKPISTWKTT